MKLYLVRHAPAERAQVDQHDAQRALTKRGSASFARAVDGLARAQVRFDLIRHSPLLRCVQTAELLTPLLDGETIVTPQLAAAARDDLLRLVSGAQAERVALVGHEPWLSELAFWLVTGWQIRRHFDHPAPFRLKKGAVAVLEGDARPGAMTLVALWQPKMLRALGDR